MGKKKFIKKLDEEQLKTLIILGLAECDRQSDCQPYLYNFGVIFLNDIKLEVKEFEDLLYVNVLRAKNNYHIVCFNIEDFSMTVDAGGWTTDLSCVLKKYLAYQFEKEYIEYLYETRLIEAKSEKEMLLIESSDILETYRPKGFFDKKAGNTKTKTIGTVNSVQN